MSMEFLVATGIGWVNCGGRPQAAAAWLASAGVVPVRVDRRNSASERAALSVGRVAAVWATAARALATSRPVPAPAFSSVSVRRSVSFWISTERSATAICALAEQVSA